MRDYSLVSADSHINEPPDLWKDRLSRKFRERAPRMVRMELGDAWVMEGSAAPINFGNSICGGLPPERCNHWKHWEDVPRGGYDPTARVQEQDKDGLDAEILYPTPRPTMALWRNKKDPDFHRECIQAYNGWLSDYCRQAPDRLVGTALIPTLGLEAALLELERALALPGLRSPLLGQWPSARPTIVPEDDRFWAALEERGLPLSIHISVEAYLGQEGDEERTGFSARGDLRHILVTPANCVELINTGVFDRFPRLNVVFAECDSSWVPYLKEQLDTRFRRNNPSYRPKIKELPSYYFDHNIYTTYINDYYGVVNRRFIGVTQMMWSSDYPHIGSNYPDSWKVVNGHFTGVPEDEKEAILAGNAVRVYRLA